MVEEKIYNDMKAVVREGNIDGGGDL